MGLILVQHRFVGPTKHFVIHEKMSFQGAQGRPNYQSPPITDDITTCNNDNMAIMKSAYFLYNDFTLFFYIFINNIHKYGQIIQKAIVHILNME